MKTIKIHKLKPGDNIFKMEPGAEVVGISPIPHSEDYGVVVLCDPDEPTTFGHRFFATTLEDMKGKTLETAAGFKEDDYPTFEYLDYYFDPVLDTTYYVFEVSE
jgi:hypothetical protein